MTDSQLIFGILQNNEQVWRYIYKTMSHGFVSIILDCTNNEISQEDLDDIFQDSMLMLMQKVKSGEVVSSRDGSLFSYLVQIGKFKAYNTIKKNRRHSSDKVVTIPIQRHDIVDAEMTVDEQQQMQNDFIDTALGLLPTECKTLLKHFYWNHKPMDEIASILGMRNADSAKSKKSKCMNKVKEIAAQLIEDDEFSEEVLRLAVERAALRELIEEERHNADKGFCMAALDIDNEGKDNDE